MIDARQDRPPTVETKTRGAQQGASEEIATIREELRRQLRLLEGLCSKRPGVASFAPELHALSSALEGGPKQARVRTLDGRLDALGIEGPAAVALRSRLRGTTATDLEPELRTGVRELVALAGWPPDAAGGTVVCFVGPPGVGKTTTLAKLAARACVSGRRVAIASCDGYRVGAMAQTRRYAELLDVPFYATPSPTDLAAALRAESPDLWFVDTSGRPPTASSPEVLLRHADTLPRSLSRHVILCLDANTRAADASARVRRFRPARPSSLCITKLDDTCSASGLVHAAHASRLPISVLCTGPGVPDDVTPATYESVERWLFARSSRRAA
jgi:flagellar biosynthesis protein FlhF